MKPLKGITSFMRMGYEKFNIEEVFGKNGLIGANFWDKATGKLVKTQRRRKGRRTIWKI